MLAERRRQRRRSTAGTVGGLASALIGLGIGAQRISDNSFLTHLATGRLMVDHGIVRSDAFTWTSAGEPVVVQSWLASLLYGVVDSVAGFGGLRLLMAATAALLGWLSWQLTERTSSVAIRVVLMGPTLLIGLRTWTERPLLIAFVMLAVVMLVSDGRGTPWWLGVVGALWVNIHGSWPLGIVLLAARWLGSQLNRDETVEDLVAARRDASCAKWLVGGSILGGVANPYGPALLVFPLELLGRQETLRHVAEWQASSFEAWWSRSFLLLVLGVVVAARRSGWRDTLPSLVFVAAALLSARNIPVAALVVLPMLSGGITQTSSTSSQYSSEAVRLGAGALTVLLVLLPAFAIRGPHTELDRYPIDAVNALEDMGVSPAQHHVIHPDFVGNYLDLRYDGQPAAWIDDRFELHAPSLVDDYVALLDGRPGWQQIIRRYDPDAVLWPRDKSLVELMNGDGWRIAWSDDDWVVLCPRADSCG